MMRSFVHARLLIEGAFVEGMRLDVADGRILAVAPDSGAAPGEPVDCGGRLLFAGFIDAQVNGGQGVFFNADPSVETLVRMAEAFRPTGTTALMPTFVTDTRERMAMALEAVRLAIAQGVPGIVGIHLEGPFLSPARKGAHDAALFRAADDGLVDLLGGPGLGTVLLTLAPERVPVDLIARLSERGIIVAAGHSDADAATIRLAAGAGLRGFTHLFNAMAPISARAPGCAGAALTLENGWCGVIADGHHVSDEMLQVAWRCKGRDRLMLVTDAVPLAGMPEGSTFRFAGREVRLEQGQCRNDEGVLSGSALTMRDAVLGAVRHMGVSLADAIIMASETPARFLRMEHERGRLAAGLRADFIIADDALDQMDVWMAGERVPA